MSGRLGLIDAIRLGHTNVKAHGLRSMAVVVTIGVIFGAVMAVNFVLKGLEDNLLRYAEASEGKPVLVSGVKQSVTCL